jgi:hypothetical protein|tara:strand:+ start:245 stop:610 length:366 start_codon:yes stop_codon:yes gene_type:complete
MAITTLTLSTRFGASFGKDTSANATSTQFKASSGTLYTVEIDNTAASSQTAFVKFYNLASPTVGTNAPDVILFAPAGKTISYQFSVGIAFGTAISMACVTGGGTAGTSALSSTVIVKVVYD